MALRFALVLFAGFVCGSSLRAQTPANQRTDWLGDPLPPGAIARLGTLRLKHNFVMSSNNTRNVFLPVGLPSTIIKAIYSPDAKKIASLDFSNFRMWDATSGKPLHGPWSSSKRVGAVAFSADNNLFAVSGQTVSNGQPVVEIAIWDLVGDKLLSTCQLPQTEGVQALAFANDGKSLVSAGNGIVRWSDVGTGQEKRSWKPFGEEQLRIAGGTMTKTFFGCELSAGGNFLAVQSDWNYKRTDPPRPIRGFIPGGNQDICGFDLTTAKACWQTPLKSTDIQVQFAFSADEKWAAQTVEADKVELRDTATGKLMATPPLDTLSTQTQRIGALALSSDGSTLAIGGTDSHVVIWNAAEPSKCRQFSGRFTSPTPNSLRCLTFSADNKTLLAGLDSDLQLYDVASLKEVFPWNVHRGFVDYVAFTPGGKCLVTGSVTSVTTNFRPSEVASWDMANWKATSIISSRTPKWPTIGALSADYSFFTGKDGDDRVCIYDHASGKKLGRLDVPSNFIPSPNGFFSPTGRFYVQHGPSNNGADVLQLFAIPSGKHACDLPTSGKGKALLGLLTFSPDENLVAFVSQNGLTNVCDTRTGEIKKQFGTLLEGATEMDIRARQGIGNMAFSPDNKLLASSNSLDEIIRLYDLVTGKERPQLPPGDQRRGQVKLKFAWSPDSRMLAVGDLKIQLFEIATGKLRHEFEGHQSAIFALAFSPDGRLLASGSADTTVLIWDVWGR